tara:strand:- start:976 stop:1518 length:543 start_codon:yes stop_codon:yes gene_type:complete
MVNLQVYHFINNYKKGEIESLDKKINIIYRDYNKQTRESDIKNIRDECKKSGKKFYISNNPGMAKKLKLDGIYIPSFNNSLKLINKNNLDIIGSAHNLKEIRIKEKQGVRCIFLSPIFKNKKKINYLGIYRFNYLSKLTDRKIIALGGINEINIKKLRFLKCNGYASITYLRNKKQIKLI